MMDKTSEKERMNEMIEATIKVARGDYSVQVELSGKNDELDSLAMGLNMMIDDVRTAQETLQESEERYRQLVELSPNTIAVHSEGRIVFINAAGARLLRAANPEQLVGKPIMDLLHPDYRDVVKERIRRVTEEGKEAPLIEQRFIRLDGTVVDVEVAAIPFTYRGKPAVQAIVNDISERKQAEEALARRMTELSALNAMAAIVNESVNVDEILNRAMDEALRLVGVEAAGMLLLDEEAGELVTVAQRGMSDELFQAVKRIKLGEGLSGQAAQTGQPVVIGNVREYPGALRAFLEKERIQSAASVPLVGRTRVIGVMNLGTASPQYFDPAGLELLVALGQQIAIGVEKARLYAETRAWAGELERRVNERTAELEAFSYSVSHNLRAPLRAIDGFSRILLEEYQPQLAPEAQRHLQLVRDNTQQMGRLIDDLLAFLRLGRQRLQKQPVAPADLVRQALEDLRHEQEGRRVEMTIGDPSAALRQGSGQGSGEALPVCQADPDLLKQVWVNLLSNALKFTRQREVARIEIGWIPPLSPPLPGEGCYFVKDNGMGFDMQYADKLFGVFQRLHRTEEYEGTGVGLATVQRIIHRHGGRIWAEAEVDKGATFYFTLG